MNLCSFQFFIALLAAPVLFHLVPGRFPRRLFLTLLNVAFLWTFITNNGSLACFILFLCGTYLFVWAVRKRPSGLLVFAAIVCVVVPFLLIKRYTFLEPLVPRTIFDHEISLIGISFMLFKFIHVLVDTWQGQLVQCTLFSYINYQIGFFSLVAGPIQRFNDFKESWDAIDSASTDTIFVLQSWNRLLTGFIKMGGLAPLALYIHDRLAVSLESGDAVLALAAFILYCFSYAAFLYMNFAGYTDIAIGAGRLFGFNLPENFNQPYLGRNIIDFWNRWHMTLTQWIRDYVFMTSYKAVAERSPAWSKYAGYILLCMSLFLAGLWHGSTLSFAIFGLLQGVGALIVQIYGDILKWRLGRAGFQRYQKNAWIRRVGIAATLSYFSFSLLFFALPANEAIGTIRAVIDKVSR